MTISEASKKWGIKSKTILNYIEKGLISNLSVENNKLFLPDIKKPFVVPQNAGKTLKNIYKYILTACDSQQYLDSYLFGKINLSKEEFKNYIDILEHEKYIKRTEDYCNSYSNEGFVILPAGIDELNKLKRGSKKALNITLLNIEKISLINIG